MSDQMLIQGNVAGSVNEYYVAQALDRMKLEYIYQYWFRGGMIRGGQVIDFLVQKPPRPIPLQVQGGYWHSAQQDPERAMKNAEIAQEFGEVKEIWEDECQDVDMAYSWLMENIGV